MTIDELIEELQVKRETWGGKTDVRVDVTVKGYEVIRFMRRYPGQLYGDYIDPNRNATNKSDSHLFNRRECGDAPGGVRFIDLDLSKRGAIPRRTRAVSESDGRRGMKTERYEDADWSESDAEIGRKVGVSRQAVQSHRIKYL